MYPDLGHYGTSDETGIIAKGMARIGRVEMRRGEAREEEVMGEAPKK